jgi:predicted nucleotide-binding protein
VIFELGYFFGKLGRQRTCILHRGDVELPSDYHGLLYVPMDEGGGWKLKLGQELKQAFLNVDLNKIR